MHYVRSAHKKNSNRLEDLEGPGRAQRWPFNNWLVVYGGLWRFTVVLETVDLLFLSFEDWEFCLMIFGLEATGQTRP